VRKTIDIDHVRIESDEDGWHLIADGDDLDEGAGIDLRLSQGAAWDLVAAVRPVAEWRSEGEAQRRNVAAGLDHEGRPLGGPPDDYMGNGDHEPPPGFYDRPARETFSRGDRAFVAIVVGDHVLDRELTVRGEPYRVDEDERVLALHGDGRGASVMVHAPDRAEAERAIIAAFGPDVTIDDMDYSADESAALALLDRLAPAAPQAGAGFVRWDAIRAMTDAELADQIASGGPVELVEACRAEQRDRR